MSDNCIMAPGTQARLTCEWSDFNAGDVVTIVRYDAAQGYLVRSPTNEEEFWLPIHVLSNYHNRKQWSFRFRKSNQSRKFITEPSSPVNELPEFRERLKDVTVQCGGRAVLKCTVKNCSPNSKQTWQKLEQNLCQTRQGRFILNSKNNEGLAMLNIDNVKISDSGIYQFTISWNDGISISCSAHLNVTNLYPPLEEPNIQVMSCSSVSLEWNCYDYKEFFVEYCKLGSGEWIKATQGAVTGGRYTVENLIAGETYSFRIIAKENQLVSLPSVAVTLPVTDNLRWQQDQFHRRYLELKEIARGRFSVVRLAKDRGTGVEVALKQISRRKQEHCISQAEYALLANTQHINIIRSLALFDNAPLPGVDTIVLELVRGPILFDYLSEQMEYSENDVKCYSRQLMSALNWLHKKSLAHLDIKPENVLVDVSNTPAILKLVDFGDCVNTSKNIILPPACLEFASPELVLGQPVGIHTDCWAVGVFLYVLLSGVSPFLDDSMEETTANILKCDYCFPDDYFGNISNEAKELISKLLVLIPSQRLIMEDCLNSIWLKMITHSPQNMISASRLKSFMQRRHPMNVNTTPTSATSPIKNDYNNEQIGRAHV